jgi:uncharacterized protein YrrD
MNEILDYRIGALDGELGKAKDFLFDDREWEVRYLVVDTGDWLPGRKVLISPQSVGEPIWAARLVPVSLTRGQVEKSPGIGEDLPVSRQHEMELAQYYMWVPDWRPLAEAIGPQEPASVLKAAREPALPLESEVDPHLRSTKEVLGYHVTAEDDEIGHVEDLIADTEAWAVRYIVVDTRNWLPGRKVLVCLDWVKDVNWYESHVSVALSAQAIKDSPRFDAHAAVNRKYEARLYDYYGRPRPAHWERS